MQNFDRLLLVDTNRFNTNGILPNQLTSHWKLVDVISFTRSPKIIRFLWPFFVFKKGLELFLKNKYDHIVVREHPLLLSCIATLLLHKITDRPYIVEISRPQHFLSSSGFVGKIENFLMSKFFRFEARFAKAILTLDQADGADFIHQCSKQSGKVICLTPFSDDNRLQKDEYGATLKQLFI